MQIMLNGEVQEVEAAPLTIAALVRAFPPAHRAYAVEVNKQVIPRGEHHSHCLKSDDRVEIVTLVGGG